MGDGLRGNWIVRVSDANRAGLHFWRHAIREYAGDQYAETLRPEHPHGWSVFTFASRSERIDLRSAPLRKFDFGD